MNPLSCFFSLFSKLLSAFSRLLCFLHIRRRRRDSGGLLPLHTDHKIIAEGETLTSLPSNDLSSWDTWGDEVELSNQSRTSQHVGAVNSRSWRYGQNPAAMEPSNPEMEIDYFQELNLEPSIKKTQKIVVRRKEDEYSMPGASRLAMTADIPPVSNELGLLDEGGDGWAVESREDLSAEATTALRETRRTERVNRLAEHQQRRKEQAVAASRRDKLHAVKLS